eukprot:CAMPEP_0174700860 /NCGR_PEP_ID=MMETSP1094-20130205/5687_1 /TAXON_ID=156173 /ORGANISM="Chrysochromulina brevifilum, Strain UTEX LB 985" /LENGTH=140 /DNA_ID=CAMNT_0015898415 /DNA_START=100 /DNA_END=523 /DNA_ORIENTATION=-
MSVDSRVDDLLKDVNTMRRRKEKHVEPDEALRRGIDEMEWKIRTATPRKRAKEPGAFEALVQACKAGDTITLSALLGIVILAILLITIILSWAVDSTSAYVPYVKALLAGSTLNGGCCRLAGVRTDGELRSPQTLAKGLH